VQRSELNVLVLTNMWPSGEDPSAGIFVQEQVSDLRSGGFDIDVVHFDGRKSSFEYLRAVRTIRSAFKTRRYDIVHAHFGLTGFAAVLAGARPLVTTFHGSDTGFKRWQLPISRRVARRSTPIVVEESAAHRLGVGLADVIPMGVDVDVFRPASGAAVDAPPLIVFPGSPEKRVKNYALFQEVIEELRRRGTDVRTTALVGLQRREVAAVLASADALLVTSLFEGSPVTVREALACGTPVVGVPVGDVARVLDRLPGCSCAPPDPGVLADAVECALSTPRARDTLRDAVVAVSDRQSIAARVGAVYRAVAEGCS
jgi:teichuronic acid biosynthesis glycosyltransferase TuaC